MATEERRRSRGPSRDTVLRHKSRGRCEAVGDAPSAGGAGGIGGGVRLRSCRRSGGAGPARYRAQTQATRRGGNDGRRTRPVEDGHRGGASSRGGVVGRRRVPAPRPPVGRGAAASSAGSPATEIPPARTTPGGRAGGARRAGGGAAPVVGAYRRTPRDVVGAGRGRKNNPPETFQKVSKNPPESSRATSARAA